MIFSCLSCGYFSKENKNQKIDAVIDYSKVDVSPSFKKSKNFPVKVKESCFREEINSRMQSSLIAYNFTAKEFINETILIDLLIDANGRFKLKKITKPNRINDQLPKLDSILKSTIMKLPKIAPAFKEGIPVVTQYQLPIRVSTQE